MNSIAATMTTLSTRTRPWGDPNNDPPSSRIIWTIPLAMVATIAMVEIRPKPRTAWTRSSSPGPTSTTRARRITPPIQTAIASACVMPIAIPRIGTGPPVRLNPIVTTASAGMPSAAICVAGMITRSGRNATQEAPTTSSSRASAARAGVPASSRSTQLRGLNPMPIDS